MTKAKPKVRAGTSRRSVEARRRLFVEAYLTNGNNGAQAAISAGFAPKTAKIVAAQLLTLPNLRALIADRTRQTVELAEMNSENWAREVAALSFSRPGQMYDAEGNLIPVHLLPDHVQAALASVKRDDKGTEFKFWDKNTALATMGKHLGLFERDNKQRNGPNLNLVVRLV